VQRAPFVLIVEEEGIPQDRHAGRSGIGDVGFKFLLGEMLLVLAPKNPAEKHSQEEDEASLAEENPFFHARKIARGNVLLQNKAISVSIPPGNPP
jgi:hypothetical protein